MGSGQLLGYGNYSCVFKDEVTESSPWLHRQTMINFNNQDPQNGVVQLFELNM